jgi:hypothetical protein
MYAQPVEGAMQRHFDCVRGDTQPSSDLGCGQVSAITERDELPVADTQLRDRARKRQPIECPIFESTFVGRLRDGRSRWG